MSRGPVLLQAKDVRLSLGGSALFEGVELALVKGECACLVGANGAGKSTLLKILSGVLEPDAGVVSRAGGVDVAVVPQEPDFGDAPTLQTYVEQGFGIATAPHAAQAALQAFGLDPARSPDGLSGGEARRAALARAFAAEPDVLLLDEPTNHLDIPAIEDLEQRLTAFKGAALLISHDRRFLERATRATYWLRQRRVQKLDRGFAAFDEWAEAIEVEDARQMSRLQTQLKAEEHWLQRGVTARRARNEGRRRKLFAMRAERSDRMALARSPTAKLEVSVAGEASRLVLEAKGISKAFGERTLIRNLDLRVMRGDRVGIVGPNGAGKSTLLDVLLGRQSPDAGSVRRSENLTIAFVDQARSLLDPAMRVRDALTPLGGDQVMVQGKPRHVAAYARDFLFGPEHLRQPIGALSGGERNRLALAVTLVKPADVLVLDEPTNDLDADTLDALEDMVAGFAGTVLIVSHDRAFLDDVTTQILGAIGDGQWRETPGGYADFEREYANALKPKMPAPQTREKPSTTAPSHTLGASSTPMSAPAKATRKLSYKDSRRLSELDRLMPALDAEIHALERDLNDATLFQRDPRAFSQKSDRLAAARQEKDDAETEWLTLDDLRAQLEG